VIVKNTNGLDLLNEVSVAAESLADETLAATVVRERVA